MDRRAAPRAGYICCGLVPGQSPTLTGEVPSTPGHAAMPGEDHIPGSRAGSPLSSTSAEFAFAILAKGSDEAAPGHHIPTLSWLGVWRSRRCRACAGGRKLALLVGGAPLHRPLRQWPARCSAARCHCGALVSLSDSPSVVWPSLSWLDARDHADALSHSGRFRHSPTDPDAPPVSGTSRFGNACDSIFATAPCATTALAFHACRRISMISNMAGARPVQNFGACSFLPGAPTLMSESTR